jgi:hypothetical protein
MGFNIDPMLTPYARIDRTADRWEITRDRYCDSRHLRSARGGVVVVGDYITAASERYSFECRLPDLRD